VKNPIDLNEVLKLYNDEGRVLGVEPSFLTGAYRGTSRPLPDRRVNGVVAPILLKKSGLLGA
jgi:hypothetical protein